MRRNCICLFAIFVLLVASDCEAQYFAPTTLVSTKEKKIYEEANRFFDSVYLYHIYQKVGSDSCSVIECWGDTGKRRIMVDSLKKTGYSTDITFTNLRCKAKPQMKILKCSFYKIDSVHSFNNKLYLDSVFVFDMQYTIKLDSPKISKTFYNYHITTAVVLTTKDFEKFDDYAFYMYNGTDIYELDIVSDSFFYFVREQDMDKVLWPSGSFEHFF